MFEHNVIAVSFEDRSKAYQALSELKGAGLEGRVEVLSASIVTRDEQGRLDAPEGGDTVGGAYDIRRADDSDSVLGEISRYIPLGGTAVVAEVNEYAVEVVDKLMTEQGGTVYRRPADVVLAELEATEDAYREAQKEADKAAREQRKAERRQNAEQRTAEFRQNAEERMAALKEKLDAA